MKTIEVTFYAMKAVRMQYRTTIEVPDDFTQWDIEQAADDVYAITPVGLFTVHSEDPMWDRETTVISKDSLPEDAQWTAEKDTEVHGNLTVERVSVKRVDRFPAVLPGNHDLPVNHKE